MATNGPFAELSISQSASGIPALQDVSVVTGKMILNEIPKMPAHTLNLAGKVVAATGTVAVLAGYAADLVAQGQDIPFPLDCAPSTKMRERTVGEMGPLRSLISVAGKATEAIGLAAIDVGD